MLTEFILYSDTIPIFCRSIGHGPALLLIHGSCVDSDFFLETANYLSRFFTVYLYDRRGSGRSGNAPSKEYSVAAQAKDALTILEAIGTPCYLAAHSAGCAVALELLSFRADLIQKTLLFEPAFLKYISADSPYFDTFQAVNNCLAQGHNGAALTKFFELLGPADERAKKYTSEQLKRITKNSMHFVRNEYLPFIQYVPKISLLASEHITIGLSERSNKKLFGDISRKLSAALNCPLLAFPGTHNSPRDLPVEFSYMLAGLFLF